LTLLLSACAAPAAIPTRAPERLPPIELTSLDARHVPVDAVVSGRPALVAFWATWCTACADEFDTLNKVDASAKQKGAVVVGIAVGEEHEKVAAFVKDRGLAYAQLVDEDFHFSDAMGQRKLPAIFVVDRRGMIVHRGSKLDAEALASFKKASDGP
jgi:cytochrome c biogenesis protein CcmG, thiol:disulfide interchange protein DsbE